MLDVPNEHLERSQAQREPRYPDCEHEPQRYRQQQPFEAHRFAEERQHHQHYEVASELQHQRRRDRGIHNELVREGDLADEPRVASDRHRASLQRFLSRDPRP